MNDSLAKAAHRQSPGTGVLLVNLGTPEAPTVPAIRRYLAQFLVDRRVVELPRGLWWPVLHGVILPLRPRRLAHAYGEIWTADGSPLLSIAKRQTNGLRERLNERHGRDIPVVLAMTYGQPSIPAGLAELQSIGSRRILIFPLFPQYSGSTTGAVMDGIFAALRGQRWLPELRTINSYHDDSGYIKALAASLRRHWDDHGRGEHLVISFHGIPRKYVLSGDPYYCQCQKTARLVAEALFLERQHYSVTFQSRFGKAPWIRPYTNDRIRQLASSGVRSLDVICPGFSADCLETLEEVSLRYKAEFLSAGGAIFSYVPALNHESVHLDALATIINRNIDRWLPVADSSDDIRHREVRAEALRSSLFGTATGEITTER